jgi:hypothetical protein
MTDQSKFTLKRSVGIFTPADGSPQVRSENIEVQESSTPTMAAPHAVLSALAQWLREPPIYDLPFTSDEIDLVAAQAKAMADRIEQLEAAVNELDFCQGDVIQVKILQGPHKGIVVTIERPKDSA